MKLSEYVFFTRQMGRKKGLKILEEKGEEEIKKELQQIHNIEGFEPTHWHYLTKEKNTEPWNISYTWRKREMRR